MNTPSLNFAGMAHIVRPKHAIDFYRGFETAKATQSNPNETIREWRQSFPFDHQQDEVVMLWGKDLQKAGDTADWNFDKAYAYATGIIKDDAPTLEGDTSRNGGGVSVGRTQTQGRAAVYRHPQ